MSMKKELKLLLDEIDNLINQIEAVAERQEMSKYEMRNTDGSFTLGDLLTAKANIICALVMLKELNPKSIVHLIGLTNSTPICYTPYIIQTVAAYASSNCPNCKTVMKRWNNLEGSK